MMQCLNCYYHSFIGLENWCCHPGHAKRIKKPRAKCSDHFLWDKKDAGQELKLGIDKMIEIKDQPHETCRLTHSGTAIECLMCGETSFNHGDVLHRYCGKCKRFHDDFNS